MPEPARPLPNRPRPAVREPARPARRRFSRPELRHALTVHSEHGQRLARRGMQRAASALYGLEVVLYALNENQDAVEALEETIDARLAALGAQVEAAVSRYQSLLEAHEGMPVPTYRHPLKVTLAIASPRMMTYALLIEQYDQLVQIIDRLWFGQVVKNREHANAIYGLRTAFFEVGNSLTALEQAARETALRRGALDREELDAAARDGVLMIEDGEDAADP